MIYFVATPIGNLKDISYRAIEVLGSVDIIACEDTRNSLKLLNHYNISKKLIAYHKFNENSSSDGIISLAESGKNIAIISDSGMPVISDPGNVLIKKLKDRGIEYTVIPGANAGLCALLLSGLDSSRFTFVGFLPDDKKQKNKILREIKDYSTTLIFYVAPHDVAKTVKTLFDTFGARRAVLVNEITKLYEKMFNFTLCENFEFEAKGEYVLVVEGNVLANNQDFENMTIEEHLKYYLNLGMQKADVIKKVAKERNIPKNEVYIIAIDIN